MTALVDTNVVLDVMLDRQPFVRDSGAVFAAVEASRCRGMLCATTVTTIHYIARRHLGSDESLARISELLSIFEVAAVNRAVLCLALAKPFGDFEDAVLHNAAVQSGVECIVTRNVADFRRAKIPIYTPPQFIEALGADDDAESDPRD